jgi:MAE_28990/MAE_18760-like HEPN
LFSIKADFEEKRGEAEQLINHINEVSKESGNVNTVSILKSSFIILLYNAVESTTVLVLEKVHDKASRHNYVELSDHLKQLFVEFYLLKENQKKQKKTLNLIIENSLTFPIYIEFVKKFNLFSGNLDARELSKIISRYGIGKISSKDKDKLLIVKNNRNKIAHGEMMFKECCRNMTIRELDEIKKAVFDALSQMIIMTEYYFEQKRYLNN